MQQRDYLKEQIEQLGKVLSQLLAKVLGREGHIPESLLNEVSETYRDQLDFDVFSNLKLTDDAFKRELSGLNMAPPHLETMARTLQAIAANMPSHTEKRNALKKALLVLEVMEEQSKMVSFEHLALVQTIKQQLDRIASE